MGDVLWSETGKGFFDVWFIMHLSFWIYMGSCLWSFRIPLPNALLGSVCIAYCWELFERYAEPRWPHIWLTPESWVNAYVSDPSTAILGVSFAWYALQRWRKV